MRHKENPVVFVTPGELKSNDALTVNPNQPPVGSYSWQQGGMTICCINYNYRMAHPQDVEPALSKAGSMVIYPNPATQQLTIKYQMVAKEKVQITLYDLTGRKIANWQPPFKDNSQVCYYTLPLQELDVVNGMYLLEITNGTEAFRTKLMLNK